MRTMIQVGVVAMALCLLAVGDAAGRGGRGGGGGGGGMSRGGGGGGGMSRPSPSMSRSPAVSRPAGPAARPSTPMAGRPSPGARPSPGTRPSPGVRPSPGARPGAGGLPGAGVGPGAGARPGTGARPSAGDLQSFLNIPKPATGAIGAVGAGARPGGARPGAAVGAGVAGGAAAEFLQNRGGADRPTAGQLPAAGDRVAAGRGDGRADRVDNRMQTRDDRMANRPDRIENREEWRDNRGERRDEIRDQVEENHPRLDFWTDHPTWAAWRINRPYRWATWGALTGWVGYGWSQAYPYSYGEDLYYADDSVYYGGEVVASAEEYTQQAEQIATSAPEVEPAQAEWLPLGVFALTPDGQASGPDPTLFLQLAISKEGMISGLLHNTATNSTQSIEGMADKESQRCAWTVAGKTRPIMETGIGNLTEDTAPALVHFADGQTQQWLMVRLEEPAGQQ